MTDGKKPEGLGGWLLLVGLGVIISPLLVIFTVFPNYLQVFSGGAWPILTTPGSPSYHPLWAPLIVAEILLNTAYVAAWIVALVLYFRKRKGFPRLYIGLLLFTMTFILADAAAFKLIRPDEPMLDPDTLREFSRSVTTALIWVPYMLVSKRVKATFVH